MTQNLSIIDSGPVTYGLLTGVWTTDYPRCYYEGYVRKLFREFGFSVQRPKRLLIKADKEKWAKETYPEIKKAYRHGSPLIFEDEASFPTKSSNSRLELVFAPIGAFF